MQRLRQLASGTPVPPKSQKESNIPVKLKEYFSQKQPMNKNVQPFEVSNFEAFDRAIYDYMVELREQAKLQGLAQNIASAQNYNSLNSIEARVNKLSNSMKSPLKESIKQKKLALFSENLSRNLATIPNLNAYEERLRKRYNSQNFASLENAYNKRLGNIRRKQVLNKANLTNANIEFLKGLGNAEAKNRIKKHILKKNVLSNANKEFLKNFGNNSNVLAKLATLKKRNNKNARAAVAVVKLWGHAGTGGRSNTSNGKNNALQAAIDNQTLNLRNLSRSNLIAILNDPRFAPPTNNSGNNRTRHVARVKTLLNSLTRLNDAAAAAAAKKKAENNAAAAAAAAAKKKAENNAAAKKKAENNAAAAAAAAAKKVSRGATLTQATQSNKQARRERIAELNRQITALNSLISSMPKNPKRKNKENQRTQLQELRNGIPKNNLN